MKVEEAGVEFIDVQASPIQFSLQLAPERSRAPEPTGPSDSDVLVVFPRTSLVPTGASLMFGVGSPVYADFV